VSVLVGPNPSLGVLYYPTVSLPRSAHLVPVASSLRKPRRLRCGCASNEQIRCAQLSRHEITTANSPPQSPPIRKALLVAREQGARLKAECAALRLMGRAVAVQRLVQRAPATSAPIPTATFDSHTPQPSPAVAAPPVTGGADSAPVEGAPSQGAADAVQVASASFGPTPIASAAPPVPPPANPSPRGDSALLDASVASESTWWGAAAATSAGGGDGGVLLGRPTLARSPEELIAAPEMQSWAGAFVQRLLLDADVRGGKGTWSASE